MFTNFKKNLTRIITNLPGLHVNRKIIVIESDDWGSVRMSSKYAFNELLKNNYAVNNCPYNINDALEGNRDLESLFEVLLSIKNIHGQSLIFTANNIVTNPNFSKIREFDFQHYFYESFTETLKNYPEHDRVIDLYNQGISNGIFIWLDI